MGAQLATRAAVANETRRWLIAEQRPDGDPADLQPAVGGRVVAVAHAFDTLCSPVDGRVALLADEALRVLLGEAGRRYDPWS